MIKINEPGVGQLLMDHVHGNFREGVDQVISTHSGSGELMGGVVYEHYWGNSIAMHSVGLTPRWCSRDMMWMMFHYPFRQIGCGKVIATVRSDNLRALSIDFRAGFKLEATIKDAVAPGVHLMVLTMSVAECRWLKLSPQQYLPGGIGIGVFNG